MRKAKMRLTAIPAVGLLALSLTACGGPSGNGNGTGNETGGAATSLRVVDYYNNEPDKTFYQEALDQCGAEIGVRCSPGAISRAGNPAMSARGAGSMAMISPRPPRAFDRIRVEWPEPTSTMRRGLRSRTSA